MKHLLAPVAVCATFSASSVLASPVQDGVAWNDVLFGSSPRHHGVRTVARGETISVASLSHGEFIVRRLDENGDVVHSTVVDMPVALDVVDFDVADDDSVIVLLSGHEHAAGGHLTRAVRIDSAGAFDWSREVTYPASPLLEGHAIAFAPNGEIVVAGGRRDGSAPDSQVGAWLIWLDGDGDRLRWRRSPTEHFRVAVASDGSARVVRRWNGRFRLERIDADETVAWSNVFLPHPNAFLEDVWIGPAGQSLVVLRDYNVGRAKFIFVDAAGSITGTWTGSELVPRTNHAQFLSGGDVVTSGERNYGYVRRFDPAGHLRFEFGSLVFPDGATAAAVDSLDRTWFCRLEATSSTTTVHRVHVVDANGAPITDFVPEGVSTSGGSIEQMAADGRGNVVAASTVNGSVATTKLVIGVAGAAQVGCAQGAVNSTGASATLIGAGSELASLDGLTLLVRDLPSSTVMLPLVSDTASFVAMPGGSQGDLCLGGTIGRFAGPGQVRMATVNGLASFQVTLDRIPRSTGFVQGTAGETWHFQGWYRDANPGSTSNFTNAWTVTLQ